MRPDGRRWLIFHVKVALMVIALCACERADSSAKKAPPPTPTKPDPIKQAQAEFELLPAAYAAGTQKLYSRGELMPDADAEAPFDQGDFIGRLRTLFGPREGDEYVLRHEQTGYLIVAYSGDSGPSYGGGARYPGALPPADPAALARASFAPRDDPAAQARRKADPVLAKGSPFDHASPNHPVDLHEVQVYMKHAADADAGPELAGAIARLEALVEAVPPADWEKTFYVDDTGAVIHTGAKGGHSFNDELPAAQGFEFLATRAEAQDRKPRDADEAIRFTADSDLLDFYLAHQEELAAQRPRALAAYRRLLVEANSSTGDVRRSLLDEARDFASKLHVAAP